MPREIEGYYSTGRTCLLCKLGEVIKNVFFTLSPGYEICIGPGGNPSDKHVQHFCNACGAVFAFLPPETVESPVPGKEGDIQVAPGQFEHAVTEEECLDEIEKKFRDIRRQYPRPKRIGANT